ncbi:MAG TPA: chemotaxis protein CheW, partial [Polyangiaceae bacterium]
MSASGPLLDVERLRSEFDAAFALPHSRSAGESDDYLLIQAGTNPYALALAELGEVVADVPITRVPSTSPALLGVAGRRGKLVPVFDLAL